MAGPTVDATTFSKWGPELAARAGGGPLVLAGVSTDCCVLSTALAAADDGVTVRVVSDACAGVDDESHAQALHIMSLYGPLVEVVTVADVLGEARPAQRLSSPVPTAPVQVLLLSGPGGVGKSTLGWEIATQPMSWTPPAWPCPAWPGR